MLSCCYCNRSQTKFVALRLVLSVFYAIDCLTQFCSNPFDFFPQNWDKQVVPSGIYERALVEPFSSLVSKYVVHRNCFGDLYLWCEGRFREVNPTPHTHIHTRPPPPSPHTHTSHISPPHFSPLLPNPHPKAKNPVQCSQKPPSYRWPSAMLRPLIPPLRSPHAPLNKLKISSLNRG